MLKIYFPEDCVLLEKCFAYAEEKWTVSDATNLSLKESELEQSIALGLRDQIDELRDQIKEIKARRDARQKVSIAKNVFVRSCMDMLEEDYPYSVTTLEKLISKKKRKSSSGEVKTDEKEEDVPVVLSFQHIGEDRRKALSVFESSKALCKVLCHGTRIVLMETEHVDEDIKKKKRGKVRSKGEQARRLCFGQDANVEMLMKFAMSNVSHRGVCRVSSSSMLPLIRGADGIVARSMMGRTLPFGLAMQLLESVRRGVFECWRENFKLVSRHFNTHYRCQKYYSLSIEHQKNIRTKPTLE